jgi:signal transduction histidine kinase
MKTILVIEDDPTLREFIHDLLELHGFRAISGSDGSKGIELARKHLPDLILCDVQMSDCDGYEVLTTLHQHPPTATIPFIFLTARSTRADIRHGMLSGADDYLTKPCNTDELFAAISRRLKKQAVVQAQSQQQLDNLRSSITLNLPHELRTPITGILSSAEILRALAYSAEPQDLLDIADNLQNSTERLYRLVQNFLLYAELEVAIHDPNFPGRAITKYPLNLKQLVASIAVPIARSMEREADLHLLVPDLTLDLPEVELKKALEELIDNAFKFSKPGSPVEVSSNLSPQGLTLEITDCGRGMTPEQIAKLGAYMQFDRQFYEQQGTGLGLAIAKRLLELCGGSLTITSQTNQRTTVCVSLPV